MQEPHILHVAAENDRLPGCKVGGMADVLRDVAPALAELGCRVTLLTPSYGYLHRLPGAKHLGAVGFVFRGGPHWADIYEVPERSPHPGVRSCVIQHPWIEAYDFGAGRHRIYVHDFHEPFYSDASRFACFAAAAASAIAQERFGTIDALHLHDWHTAPVALLLRHSPAPHVRTVFSIHNLALQGLRPLRDNDSSLEAWFPGLPYYWIDVGDPQWSGCFNPMATGIRLADVVHTVSPTYAEEIGRPSDKPHFYGAERLASVIRYPKDAGRLIGILNGCDYPDRPGTRKMAMAELAHTLQEQMVPWSGAHGPLPAGHFAAYQRLEALARRSGRPQMLLTSVSRLVEQKFLLMRIPDGSGRTALQRILEQLGDDGCYVLLGSGDPEYERFFAYMCTQHSNFIFLNGYSDLCASLLYANGDLFVMPSSYEPCGIAQMLSMREGQPCLVHAVGGLRDTVQDSLNGFSFDGNTIWEQADNFVATAHRAGQLKLQNGESWERIRQNAAAARFLWRDSARLYLERLYGLKTGRKRRPHPGAPAAPPRTKKPGREKVRRTRKE